MQNRVLALSAEAKRRPTKEMWQVRKDQEFLPRLGKTMIGCLLRSETVRSLALSRVAKIAGGLTVVGHGSEQIVMADGNDVVKLLFATIERDEALVSDKAKKLQSDSDKCQSYLGDYWLPTSYDSVALTGSDKFAVVARQERLVNPTLFPSAADVQSSEQRRLIAENIFSLNEATGMFPDILGPDNIAMRSGGAGLCQIDTIPVQGEIIDQISNGQLLTNGELIKRQVSHWLDI